MNKKEIISLLILLVVILIAGYRYFNRTYKFADERFAMDTVLSIQIETKNKNGEEILNAAYRYAANLDSTFSYYKKDSQVYKINTSTQDSIVISSDIKKMLEIGKKLYLQTDSLYDLSIGDLVDLWDFEEKIIPNKTKIDSALKYVDFYKVKLIGNKLLKDRNIKLNFGSIAKGLIIDKISDFLIKKKAGKFIVNAGGDIKIYGYKKPVKIGIQHPRKKNGDVIATLNLGNLSVVTSGDYERYFIKDKVRYHHILNPKTGYPQRYNISVTVIAKDAVLADAYSTALFLLPPKKAIKLANNTPEIDAILFYQREGKIFYKKSFGMDKYLINITDNNVREEK